jgi:hypothetical protein
LDNRVWLVMFAPPQFARHIVATGWLRSLPSAALDLPLLAEQIEQALLNQAAPPLSHQLSVTEDGSRLISYQLLAIPVGNRVPVICERIAALKLLPQCDRAIQLEITSVDATAFADLPAQAARLLDSLTTVGAS